MVLSKIKEDLTKDPFKINKRDYIWESLITPHQIGLKRD